MPDFLNYTPIDLKTLLNNITAVQYNPSSIKTAVLTALSDSSNGLIDIVDPSNPFVFLLESACVCASAAINENDLNTYRTYSKLAVTPNDVYAHMSDVDYINQFAVPTTANFTVMIEENSFAANAKPSQTENGTKIIIPRNTVVSVNGVSFSLQYPVQILKYNTTGLYQVSYDTTIISPLQDLISNIIPYIKRTDSNKNSYISFTLPLTQFDVISSQFDITKGTFSNLVNFNTNYYYCRVYYQNANTNGKWVEVPTTYSQQVFDPTVLTAVIKVVGNTVNISIPQIYITTNKISGTVRTDIYETNGNLQLDMSNFNIQAFNTSFLAFDLNDNNQYTQALNNTV